MNEGVEGTSDVSIGEAGADGVVVPPDRVFRKWLWSGLLLGLLLPAVAWSAAEVWDDGALAFLTLQALAASAAIPFVAILGLLNFLEESPLVRWFRTAVRPAVKAVETAQGAIRGGVGRRPRLAILGVGYVVGAALMEQLGGFLETDLQVHDGWRFGGILGSAVLLLGAELLMMRQERRR